MNPATAPDAPQADAPDPQLAERFWERIRLFAASRLGSVAAAEDVAQETLRRVTEALRAGRLRQPEALPGFVFQTALHICLQHHRSEGRESRSLQRLALAGRDDQPDALAGLIAEERRAKVHAALSRLRSEDRELLRLIYFQDLEPDAVARRLGLSPGAMRVRKHRALQRLAALVDGDHA